MANKILNSQNLFCRKFAAVRRKSATSARCNFLNARRRSDTRLVAPRGGRGRQFLPGRWISLAARWTFRMSGDPVCVHTCNDGRAERRKTETTYGMHNKANNYNGHSIRQRINGWSAMCCGVAKM